MRCPQFQGNFIDYIDSILKEEGKPKSNNDKPEWLNYFLMEYAKIVIENIRTRARAMNNMQNNSTDTSGDSAETNYEHKFGYWDAKSTANNGNSSHSDVHVDLIARLMKQPGYRN